MGCTGVLNNKATRNFRALNHARLAERQSCADYIERKAAAVSALLGEGKVSAEVADHVARVAREFAHELREGLHRD